MTFSIKKIAIVGLHSLLLGISILSSHAAISVERMRCEYLTDPLGINETQPRLDWLLTSSGATPRDLKQTSYHLLVSSSSGLLAHNKGDLWDSGEVASDATNQIVYAGSALTSRERCYWKVQVHDSAGGVTWSKPAVWEMGGLLKPEGLVGQVDRQRKSSDRHDARWPSCHRQRVLRGDGRVGAKDVTDLVKGLVKDDKAAISVNNDPMGGDPAPNHVKQLRVVYTTGSEKHSVFAAENTTLNLPAPTQNVPYLRKDFTLTKPVAKARLYATALGLYELHLNGKRGRRPHLRARLDRL